MDIGIITAYIDDNECGQITDVLGNKLIFRYEDGQNMLYGDGLTTPQFSGHHEQSNSHALKVPVVGDTVTFVKSASDKVKTWGYARHFIDLIERKHGTAFVT